MTSPVLSRGVVVRAPAKLNLFLELLRRRADGYHDIDTVMVPINCYDTLLIRQLNHQEIRIETAWHPSRQLWMEDLGGAAEPLLDIPGDSRNLIHRAIRATAAQAKYAGGWEVVVRKRIPAGAGMGGASSDAAAAIRAVAAITGLANDDSRLLEIAADIGSDVPFFLGIGSTQSEKTVQAMRATGRGERLTPLRLGTPLRFLVVYPATSLSTAAVYRESVVAKEPVSAEPILAAMDAGDLDEIGRGIANRLAQSAAKLSPMVADLLEQMWRCGLPRCQLTGSGSACFSILGPGDDITTRSSALRRALVESNIKAHMIFAHTTSIPQRIHWQDCNVD